MEWTKRRMRRRQANVKSLDKVRSWAFPGASVRLTDGVSGPPRDAVGTRWTEDQTSTHRERKVILPFCSDAYESPETDWPSTLPVKPASRPEPLNDEE